MLSYDRRQILDNVSFRLTSGEMVGLLGPNGAGKSTIFNILIGLVKPNYGKIIINGQNVTDFPIYLRSRKYKIGYVPQYGGYFHDLTLFENLKAIGEIIIKNERERNVKINSLISKFALDNVQEVRQNFFLEVKKEN